MADKKISDLSAKATPSPSDYTVILDVSDTTMGVTGTDKKTLVGALYCPAVPIVLQLPAGGDAHIDHGQFWVASTAYNNNFFYEAWIARLDGDTGAGYLISEGRGGAHALLCGYSSGLQSGNMWNGTGSITDATFGGDDSPAIGEWHHYAVGWDGSNVVCYIDGVPTGTWPFTSTTCTTGRVAQQGQFYVGGSDHNMLGMRIASLRGIEGAFPFDSISCAFRPELFFGTAPLGTNQQSHVSILADYTTPCTIVPDHSPAGYLSYRHPGRLFNATSGIDIYHTSTPGNTLPVPGWVADPLCPLVRAASSLPTSWGEAARTQATVPTGAIVFDSFERRNNTWAHSNAPTLGSTEGGSAGVKTWLYSGSPGSTWGILYGRAVYLDVTGIDKKIYAWVDTGTANQKVSVTRRKGSFGTGETGIAFRVVDGANAMICEARATGHIRLVSFIAGSPTDINDYTPSNSAWTTLTVNANGTTITISTELETVGTVTSSQFQTATGAGIATGMDYASQITGLGRWDNFTVLAAT